MTKFQRICIASILLSGLFQLNNDSQAQPEIANITISPSLSADTNKPNTSTFLLGETIKIYFTVSGLPNDKKPTLILDIQNEFGESIVKLQPVPLLIEERGRAKYTLTAPASKLGYYEVHAKLSDGTPLSSLGTRPAGLISYAVVPDPQTRVDYGDTLSRFGLQGGYNISALVIPYLGVRYMLSGNQWHNMEPEYPGQFIQNRRKADQTGKRYPPKAPEYENPLFNGKEWATYHISLVMGSALPSWALKPNTTGTICRTFGELNDEGIKALPLFASAQAQAFSEDYKYQKSNYYQVTWEPATGWCFNGTPEGLVQLFEKSYNAIHQSDPRAIVTGPTLFVDKDSVKQLEGLLKAGLAKYIDALSFHPYGALWPPETNGFATNLRKQLEATSKAKGRTIPFIGTEKGYATTDIGSLHKAMGDIRVSLIMLGEGASVDFGFYVADFEEGESPKINRGYGYYWNLNPKLNFGSDKLGPKISVPAYAAMTYFLDGTTSEGLLTDVKGTQLGYKFKKPNATISVVWDYGSSSSYHVPEGARVCDWMGNCAKTSQKEVTVSDAPTYLIVGTVP